ncbi:unnamed protein product [Schistosoma rodhaini]|uniref:Small integral membrane protein 14 n=1 Tax=Schistosoma rodhaini TaxID=6188 RepID=A0AA85FRM5_9TREM|nr:unnamed protein product [Schistosoma rodhaini]
MSDESGYDLCECIQSHNGAMRQLLGILRQTQEYCSDSSCVDDLSHTPQSNQDPMSGTYIMTFVAMLAVFAAVLFGLPRFRSSDGKPRNNFQGPNRDPPAIS